MSGDVAVVGLWHQGVVAAACLAEWGHHVTGADHDTATIAHLQSARAPLFEPGLDALIQTQLSSGRLRFTSDIREAVAGKRFVLITVDVPVDENDLSDLRPVFDLVAEMTPTLEAGVTVLVTAQVPVGTCDRIASSIRDARPELGFTIAYSPENLRLGQALERFRRPELPVLGGEERAIEAIEHLFARAGVSWQRCSIRTAEMTKHALNAFLAVSVCFANELGALCDEFGADGHRLAQVLRHEPRIGAKAMLFPGLGFAGGTLARDMQTLRGLGNTAGIDTPLLDGAWTSNQQQSVGLVRRLRALLGGQLAGRRIAILGLTYKPGTSTLRRSASIEVIRALVAEGAVMTAHDPKATASEVRDAVQVDLYDDPHDALRGADALVLMTAWPEYEALDFGRARSSMAGDIVFDTAGLWKDSRVTAAGLQFVDIGRGRNTPRPLP